MTYTDRISIQVSLSGYSFGIHADSKTEFSGWLSPDRIFATKEFQSRHEEVEISLFTPKCTLVPTHFFSASRSRELLAEVCELNDADSVDSVEIPWCDASLVYSLSAGEAISRIISDTVLRTDGSRARVLPEMYFLLRDAYNMNDYNRIAASYADGRLYLAVFQGKTLLLANSFESSDFITAEYFLFMVLKKLQLNPEQSLVYFRTPLEPEWEMSLYGYFKGVERI